MTSPNRAIDKTVENHSPNVNEIDVMDFTAISGIWGTLDLNERLSLVRRVVNDPQLRYQANLLSQMLNLADFDSVIDFMTENESILFLDFFLHITSIEERERVVIGVVNRRTDEKYEPFLEVLGETFESNTISLEDKNRITVYLFSAFPHAMQDALLETIFENGIDGFSALLSMVTNDTLLEYFLYKLIKKYEDEEDFTLKIQEAVDSVCTTYEQKHYINHKALKALMNIDNVNGWFKNYILDNIKHFNEKCFSYLLLCGNRAQRFQITAEICEVYETQKMNTPLNLLFDLVESIDTWLSIVSDCISGIEPTKEDVEDFAGNLIECNSVIVPYLCEVLSDAQFIAFKLIDTELIGEVLRNTLFSTPEEMECARLRLSLINSRTVDLLEEVEIDIASQEYNPFALFSPTYMSFRQVIDMVENLIKEEDDSLLSNFEEDLQKIPPFLIACAVPNEKFRNTLSQVLLYMNEQQIKAFAACLKEDEAILLLNQLCTSIQEHQFAKLIDGLCMSCRTTFILHNWIQLQELLKQLNSTYEDCQIQVRRISKSKMESDFGAVFAEVDEKVDQLLIKLRYLNNPLWKLLQKYLPVYSNNLPIAGHFLTCISEVNERVREVKLQMKGEKGILTELKSLRPEESEEDYSEEEVSNLYWEKLTNQYLVHFGINHAGEISKYGIQSDDDFTILGLSRSRLNDIDQLCICINQIHTMSGAEQLKIDKKWDETILSILDQPESVESRVLTLRNCYRFNDTPMDELWKNAKKILSRIRKITWMDTQITEKCKMLTRRYRNLRTDVERLALCKQAVRIGIMCAIENNFYIRLQKYLKQNSCRWAWDKFKMLMISSLKELSQRQYITTEEHVFNLNQIKTGLKIVVTPIVDDEDSYDSYDEYN